MIAIARIAAAEHGLFNRSSQVAPLCTAIRYVVPWVNSPNGISISSAVFAGLTVVTNAQAHMQ